MLNEKWEEKLCEIAKKLGITEKKQITVMVHTGSRALGHQVCTDSLRNIEQAMKQYKIKVPDRDRFWFIE